MIFQRRKDYLQQLVENHQKGSLDQICEQEVWRVIHGIRRKRANDQWVYAIFAFARAVGHSYWIIGKACAGWAMKFKERVGAR